MRANNVFNDFTMLSNVQFVENVSGTVHWWCSGTLFNTDTMLYDYVHSIRTILYSLLLHCRNIAFCYVVAVVLHCVYCSIQHCVVMQRSI